MNILPKKSWHVRNKDNIERVRRDEEKAAEEEKEKQRRIAIAESEARTELLRQKSRSHHGTDVEVPAVSSQRHINFFEDIERGEKLGGNNAEREEEKRVEKEKQEKALGLLKYLGQGSAEFEVDKPWYFKAPEKRKHDSDSNVADKRKDEVDSKKKRASDPMCSMNAYVDQSIKVRKLKHGSSDEGSHHHHQRHKSEKKESRSIEEMRAERMRREQLERHRSEQLITRMHGGVAAKTPDPVVDDRQRRYNSQFNPDLARRPRPLD